MNKNSKLCAVISYITWIGWIIAFVLHDKKDSFVRQHLNQALVLNIIGFVTGLITRLGNVFGAICTVIDVVVLVLCILGIVRAAQGKDEPLPVIGTINLLGKPNA